MAISGVGVGVVGIGALLIYAGLQDENPIAALKEIAKGKPRPVDKTSHASSSASSASYATGTVTPGNGSIAGLAATAYSNYGTDQYSQLKRSQSGYSDCSSFVSKAMRAYGIKNFPMLSTGGFLVSPDWVTITEDKARPGDIAVNGSHMAIVGGRNANGELIGVGQQNPSRNVQVDTMKNLMYGTGAYQIRRYKKADLSGGSSGKSSKPSTPSSPSSPSDSYAA